MSVSQAQNCKDTLFVQIKNVGTVVNLEDDYKPLKGDTLNQQKTPKVYLVTDILFLKDYKSYDSLDLEYLSISAFIVSLVKANGLKTLLELKKKNIISWLRDLKSVNLGPLI